MVFPMRERHATAGPPRVSAERRQRITRKSKTVQKQPDRSAEFHDPAFLTSLVENSPDCIKVLDAEGTLLSINVNGCGLLEIDDPSVVLNQSWLSLWPEREQPKVKAALKQAAAGKRGR